MWFKKLLKKRERHVEMEFVDHLEELRWHIIRSFIAVIIGGGVIFIYRNEIFDYFILGPLHKDFLSYQWMCTLGEWLGAAEYLCLNDGISMKLQSTSITGIFNTTIKISLIGGIIVAFPYLVWELWRFIKPALQQKEIARSQLYVFYVSLLFFVGVLFGYYVIAPFSINFLFNFNIGNFNTVEIKPTITDYLENFTTTVLGVAIAFELPIVIYILAKLAIINAKALAKFRRYAVIIILFVAAVITPSPDWISQMIVAIPLLLLFELSILVTKMVDKKRKQEDEKWQ